MALTPADVHNVAFSRARIGKRGYCEQEVDLFIDLVEQELIRHIEADSELRSRNAELRNRDGGIQKREADLAEREAALRDYEGRVRTHEAQVRRRECELAQREGQLAEAAPLPRQVAQLRHREAQVAQREAKLEQREAELVQHEAELRQYEAELRQHQAALRQRIDQQQAVAARIDADAVINSGSNNGSSPVARRHPKQLRGALAKGAGVSVAVNGTSRREETRGVAAVGGRHDMERMAIRAVTDTHGNTVTETVHERTRRSPIENGGLTVASEQTAMVEQLKQENAELARSLALLKSAVAALATALEGS